MNDANEDRNETREPTDEELDTLLYKEEVAEAVDELLGREFEKRLALMLAAAIETHPERQRIREECVPGMNLIEDPDRAPGWLVAQVQHREGQWIPILRFDARALSDD